MKEQDNEALKKEVRQYWEEHPCGTQFTPLEAGSPAFFKQVEEFREWSQPYMGEVFQYERFAGKTVLEIGCGLGTDLMQFAKGGAVVTGVDLTAASIDLTRKRFELTGLPVHAQTADAEHLPFPDASFDVVYSYGVLHHTPNTVAALREAQRVLRPGGTLLLMLYHRHSLHVWLGNMLNRFTRSYAVRSGSVDEWVRVFDGEDNPLGKAYSRSEVRRMLPDVTVDALLIRDPVRRKWPAWLNKFNQRWLAPWCGFYLHVRGTKRTASG